MKNKGFTLIELLVVIVILAIIALIATPIILNIIDNTKQEGVKRSIEQYMRAVDIAIIAENLTEELDSSECEIGATGNLSCKYGDKTIPVDVKMDGIKPIGGFIYFKNGKIDKDKKSTIVLDGNTYTIDANGNIAKDEASNEGGGNQTIANYTVTFNSNGGSAVSSQTVKDGEKVTKPTNPTKSGFAFSGWTLNGNDYDFNKPVTDNITLVAKWVAKACVLTNDTNGNNQVNLGEEVTCGAGDNAQMFMVIPNDSSAHPTATGNNITLLTKYNLDVGNIVNGATDATSITTPTGIQNSEAIGYKAGAYPHYGTIDFSTEKYWGSLTEPTFVYNNQSLLYTHVENYKTYMANLGLDVKEASLASKAQTDEFKNYTNFNPTSFWLGSASTNPLRFRSDGGSYNAFNYANKTHNGVRPIIVIPLSEVGI